MFGRYFSRYFSPSYFAEAGGGYSGGGGGGAAAKGIGSDDQFPGVMGDS